MLETKMARDVHRMRSFDRRARGAREACTAPAEVIDAAVEIVRDIVG